MSALPSLLGDKANPEAVRARVVTLPPLPIDEVLSDGPLVQSLYRDLAILTSAYLLEGKTKSGMPRSVVPACLALPLAKLARAVDEVSAPPNAARPVAAHAFISRHSLDPPTQNPHPTDAAYDSPACVNATAWIPNHSHPPSVFLH